MTRGLLAVLTAALMSISVGFVTANAQPRPYHEGYRNGYRDGYRAGYEAARHGQEYDDQAGYRDNDEDSSEYHGSDDSGAYGDRDNAWRRRYTRSYSYNDDSYYRECRNETDPAGVIAGALIGGLLGNAVGRGGGRAGATVAGVVVGGVAGAALTNHVECEDRSYVYRSYYDGFNGGREDRAYPWRNPGNGDHGEVRVEHYYTDPDGFRCVKFTQATNINGDRSVRRGTACQEPDGTWAVVG